MSNYPQVSLSFVFLIRLMPATKNTAPNKPNMIIDLMLRVPSPLFKKLKPAYTSPSIPKTESSMPNILFSLNRFGAGEFFQNV